MSDEAGERRAPRLAPTDRIAGHVTRRGRFLARDPLRARPLPGGWRWVGVLAWAGWMTYAFRRARRQRPGGDT